MKGGFLGLEIANSRIRYTYVSRGKKGYKILRSGTVNYILHTATAGALSRVVLDILSKEQFQPKKITVTLSLKEIFLKASVLPDMTPKELEGTVPDEMEKVARFANRDFRFIYHSFPNPKGGKKLVFGVVYQEVLNYIFEEIDKLKINFSHIEVSPLNLKEILNLKGLATTTGSDSILLFNDKVSYFLVYKKENIGLIYQTPFGLDNLYPQGKGTPIDDRAFASVIGELQRVLRSYLAENKDETVGKTWLIWDKDLNPDFPKLIQEHLGGHVEVPPMDEFALNEEGQEHLLNPINLLSSVPIFHVLRRTKTLFPFDRFFEAVHLKKYAIKVAIYSLVGVAIACLLAGIGVFSIIQKEVDITQKKVDLEAGLNQAKITSQPLYEKKAQYEEMRQGLLDQATYIKILNRVSWAEVLEVVAKKMPEKLSLTSFTFAESRAATFSGEAFDVETIAQVIRRIDEADILSEASFDSLTEKVIEGTKVFNFSIKAKLVKPEWDK